MSTTTSNLPLLVPPIHDDLREDFAQQQLERETNIDRLEAVLADADLALDRLGVLSDACGELERQNWSLRVKGYDLSDPFDPPAAANLRLAQVTMDAMLCAPESLRELRAHLDSATAAVRRYHEQAARNLADLCSAD